MDYAKDLIWLLFDMTGGPLPPYLFEIILRDGRSFYIHSPNSRDEETKSMVLNVYDLSAINENDEQDIKRKLDETNILDKTFSPSKLHPLLVYGRLRCNLDDILYCIEWLSRRWTLESFIPTKEARKMGFIPPPQSQ